MDDSDTKTGRPPASPRPDPYSAVPLPSLIMRAGVGGALMGMANLVPGISGGTMLLAAGIFPQFVQAVADLTRLQFHKRSLILLGTIAAAAAVVIGPVAGAVSVLVLTHTWVMYSIFIGLTLGGVPLIWRMAGVRTSAFWLGAAAGLLLMVGIAVAQMRGAGGGGGGDGFVLLFFAGIAGASAMVLPGISGGYLLLLLGAYIPILEGIEQVFTAARTLDFALGFAPAIHVILPVGLGVVLGVAGISNLVKIVLARFPRPTLGLLLGLLLGAVIGLWPFQQVVEPDVGAALKGQTVIEVDGLLVFNQTEKKIEAKDYPRALFRPTPGQVGGSLALIVLGFAVTAAVAHIGRDRTAP